jgi:hypothetical protein
MRQHSLLLRDSQSSRAFPAGRAMPFLGVVVVDAPACSFPVPGLVPTPALLGVGSKAGGCGFDSCRACFLLT